MFLEQRRSYAKNGATWWFTLWGMCTFQSLLLQSPGTWERCLYWAHLLHLHFASLWQRMSDYFHLFLLHTWTTPPRCCAVQSFHTASWKIPPPQPDNDILRFLVEDLKAQMTVLVSCSFYPHFNFCFNLVLQFISVGHATRLHAHLPPYTYKCTSTLV